MTDVSVVSQHSSEQRPTVPQRVAWVLLVFFAAAYAVNHFAGIFYIASSTDERQMFELFGWVHVLALFILVIPYRRAELWSWWAIWAAILPVALVAVFTGLDALGITYLSVAIVMAISQFVVLPRFLQHRRAG